MLRPPDAPALLAVATVRGGGAEAEKGRPAEVRRRSPRCSGGALLGDVRRIRLDRLPPDDARELATRLLAQTSTRLADRAEAIAGEAAGHPLFIQELVRHAESHGGEATVALRLDDVLWSRVLELPAAARAVLELVAVARTPIAQEVVARATSIDLSSFHRCLSMLRVGNLVQTAGPRGGDAIHVYHDRIREALVAHLEPHVASATHRELALTLESSSQADPRRLAVHWRGAGDDERAASYTVRAAAEAEAAFAFDHAAELYATALSLMAPDHPSVRRLRVQQGDALANAGRGADAAAVYLAAAHDAPKMEALKLARRAADQYLRGGHVDAGLDTIRGVLRDMRMRYPGTPRRALASALLRRLQVRLRGLRYRERDAAEIRPETLGRIDLCLSIGSCLGVVDTVGGGDFSSRALLMARAGRRAAAARARAGR